MMYAGYVSGAVMLPVSVGGKGFNELQAHQILGPFTMPISVATLVIMLGVLLGGIGFLLTYKRKRIVTAKPKYEERKGNPLE